MQNAPEPPDIPAHCRSLALQGIEMLSRLAEIAMQLAEGEGARALAAQDWAAEVRADPAGQTADDPDPRIEAREAGLAFDRFARLVQRSLSLRGRAADRLCASDKAAAAEREATRKPRRERHRNQVHAVLEDLIWDPAQPEGECEETVNLTRRFRGKLEALYGNEDDPVEDRPIASVIGGLACGLGLSDQWHRQAADWSDPQHPALTGSPAELRARNRARLIELMDRSIAGALYPDLIPALRAGLETRLREPDVEAMLDRVPPAEAAIRLRHSLALDFDDDIDDEVPDSPDTG